MDKITSHMMRKNRSRLTTDNHWWCLWVLTALCGADACRAAVGSDGIMWQVSIGISVVSLISKCLIPLGVLTNNTPLCFSHRNVCHVSTLAYTPPARRCWLQPCLCPLTGSLGGVTLSLRTCGFDFESTNINKDLATGNLSLTPDY